ncbi:YSIRK-type signal peptide-containing protein [Lactobacillus gasseri]|nr:YSIRK-type signal peptide-containing protein [Lactobacillus gasseri]
MLSKNNYQEKLRKMEPRKERFSIRKFSIGAASVLIGFSFMSMAGNQKVQAAEQQEKPAVVQNAKDNEQIQSSTGATLEGKMGGGKLSYYS